MGTSYLSIYLNHVLCCLATFLLLFLLFLLFFFPFCLFSRAAPAAYEGSQARGLIRAVATCLCHRHSNEGSEPHLQSIQQNTAMPDP